MNYDELIIFAAVFPLSAMTGIAVLLRSERTINMREIIGQALYHGLMGTAICMASHELREKFGMSVWTPLGLAVLAGLANVTALDALKWFLKRLVGKDESSP